MLSIPLILFAGLASTSWANPTPQVQSQAPGDCAILQQAYPNVFKPSIDCCTVLGVTCENGRVVQLSAQSDSWKGGNLSVLSGLDKLRTLSPYCYQCGGQIPDIFDSLPELDSFFAVWGNLTGTIPASLMYHKRMSWLAVSFNPLLTGTVGDHDGFLLNVTAIDMDSTGLQVGKFMGMRCYQHNGPRYFCNGPMADGPQNYPNPTTTGGNDPWVTWFDAELNWQTQQIGDPTNLLNGKKVVTAIASNNICGGHWAFLYEVDPNEPRSMPSCTGMSGQFNNATLDANNNIINSQSGAAWLQYGKCPKYITHGDSRYVDSYNSCWTSQAQKATFNDGGFDGGVYTFASSGMTVAYCCFTT